MSDHEAIVREQFTKQAQDFAAAPAMRNEEALQLLVRLGRAGPDVRVLDVACGPGLVACAFAKTVGHVTGIDLTPAMIEQARALQEKLALTNVSWHVGEVAPLPFAAAAFDLSVCRYAMHHFLDPPAVFREMRRVTRPQGRILIADVAVSSNPAIAAAYNQMEKLRDPSHARALNLQELEGLGEEHGLPLLETAHYQIELDLESLLKASHPEAGDAERVRQWFRESLAEDRLGVQPRMVGNEIWFAYPIVVLVWDNHE